MTVGLNKLGAKKREARKSLRQPGWIRLEGGFAVRACVVETSEPKTGSLKPYYPICEFWLHAICDANAMVIPCNRPLS